MSYFAADMSKRWSKKIHTHHQVNQASEGKILVMSSQFERTRGYYVRHDKLLVLNQTGKILKSWSARGHIKQLLKLAGIEKEEFYKFEWDKEALDKFKIKSAYEYSHLNSFYEISSESAEKNLPQFKKGNFIANFNMLGIILVFDKDLKEILWSQKYPLDKRAHIHDVQVMDNGNILIFNNNNFGGEGNHSTIDEWNPVEKKMAWQFKANPPERFFSGIVGGVQLLSSGNFLLTNINARGDLDFKQTEVLEISREGKIVSSTPIDWEGARPMVQQIKQVDLTDFLNSNKSL